MITTSHFLGADKALLSRRRWIRDDAMPEPVDFYFDFISPYGWIASRQIDAIAARHGREVVWRPLLLGITVLQVMGLKPLLDTPLKGDYLRHDVPRTARLFDLPYNPPPDGRQPNPLAAARAYYWLFDRDPALAKQLARRLYDRQWAEATDISSAEVVVETAGEFGIARETALAALADQKVKDRLRIAVEEAVARKAFGSPFIIVDDEPFWGCDRLWMVEKWLAGGGW